MFKPKSADFTGTSASPLQLEQRSAAPSLCGNPLLVKPSGEAAPALCTQRAARLTQPTAAPSACQDRNFTPEIPHPLAVTQILHSQRIVPKKGHPKVFHKMWRFHIKAGETPVEIVRGSVRGHMPVCHSWIYKGSINLKKRFL